jgi:hypothetical protein
MRKRRNIAFTISVATFLGVCVVSVSAKVSAKDLPCGDLRTAKASRLISTSQLYPHGTGCYPEDETDSKECDWKVTVDEDRNIGNDRRLVVVIRDHVTGSGAYADLTVFGCRSGKVAEVFTNSYLYGADIEEASADSLVLKVGKWALNDPHCCPSMEERRVYLWNNQKQTYVLDRKESFPIKKP